MLKNRFLIIIILLVIIFAFSGYSSNIGIDNYYFVISLGIDMAENDNLKITLQIPSTNSSSSEQSGSSQASDYNIYSVEAKSINEAITIFNNYFNRKVNLSHCNALIISEELAKENGVKTYFYDLANNTELRHTCNFIISSSTASSIIENVSNSGENFSSRLFDYLTNSIDYTGFSTDSTFGTFFQSLHNENIEPSSIYTVVSNNVIQTSGIAIFKDDKMITNIGPIDSLAHLIVTNKLNKSTITLDNQFESGNNINIEIEPYKETKISINIINGSPYINLTIYPKGTILSSGDSFDYINDENISSLESSLNDYIYQIVNNYLYSITKEYNSDIVGFEDICKVQYLTEDEFKKLHWDEIFQDSFFNISVESDIQSSNLYNKQ